MAALFQKRKKEPAEKTPVEAAQALQETIVCPACGREINKKEAEKNLYVCYECGSYFRVRTRNPASAWWRMPERLFPVV